MDVDTAIILLMAILFIALFCMIRFAWMAEYYRGQFDRASDVVGVFQSKKPERDARGKFVSKP